MKDIREFIDRLPHMLTIFMREYDEAKNNKHYELIGKLLSYAQVTGKIYIPFDLKNSIPEFFFDERVVDSPKVLVFDARVDIIPRKTIIDLK